MGPSLDPKFQNFDSIARIPTKASRLKNGVTFKTTVHSKTTEKPSKPQNIQKPAQKPTLPQEQEFNIKTARNEVLNLAISGAGTKNKKKMEIVKAVKLGAKPPKKPNKNYKELVAERKRLKDNRAMRQSLHQLGKNQTGAASVRCAIRKKKAVTNKKKKAPVSHITKNYGVVKK